MIRRLSILACCGLVSYLIASRPAVGSHPIFFYEFELVPDLSTLTVTGGFAGVYQTYAVDGTLGLLLDQRPHPPEVVQAQFGLVGATLNGEGFFDGDDLDSILNMSMWEGVIIDDDTLSFTGSERQEAVITSVADFNRSFLRVRGSSLPGCCDFFQYSWDFLALAPVARLPRADFDSDGDVDGDDLLNALLNQGMLAGADHSHGDVDGDGDVDRMDLRILQATVGEGMATSLSSPASVPEPGTLVLAIIPVLVFARRAVGRPFAAHRCRMHE